MGNFVKRIKRKLKNLLFKNYRNIDNDKSIELKQLDNFHGNNKVFNVEIGNNSYVSFNSIIYHTTIGSYCSIGPNVVIGYGDHPINSLSTSPSIYLNENIYNKKEIDEVLLPHFKRVFIGNDVWIGANVYIKNGVKIGNGAVIGAGAVILKDVNDYEIVVGVPGKVIRKRFDDAIIELLLKSEWWKYDASILKKHKSALSNPTEINLKEMIKNLSHERE